jgi:hypothetical protein
MPNADLVHIPRESSGGTVTTKCGLAFRGAEAKTRITGYWTDATCAKCMPRRCTHPEHAGRDCSDSRVLVDRPGDS